MFSKTCITFLKILHNDSVSGDSIRWIPVVCSFAMHGLACENPPRPLHRISCFNRPKFFCVFINYNLDKNGKSEYVIQLFY